jgi:hypothetical protein
VDAVGWLTRQRRRFCPDAVAVALYVIPLIVLVAALWPKA